jgi:hypothetical protein
MGTFLARGAVCGQVFAERCEGELIIDHVEVIAGLDHLVALGRHFAQETFQDVGYIEVERTLAHYVLVIPLITCSSGGGALLGFLMSCGVFYALEGEVFLEDAVFGDPNLALMVVDVLWSGL